MTELEHELGEQIRGAGNDTDALRDLEDFLLRYEGNPTVAMFIRSVSSLIFAIEIQKGDEHV